jgi:hypothetical protein
MRELLVRGKNTIDPEVNDAGGRSVEISPVKSDFTFIFKSHGSTLSHHPKNPPLQQNYIPRLSSSLSVNMTNVCISSLGWLI